MNDFPKEEFTNRISRAQESLEKENIEAIIVTSPSNFRYFSGLNSNFWESPTRPWVFNNFTKRSNKGKPSINRNQQH
mgnify:CR=1 FL=1